MAKAEEISENHSYSKIKWDEKLTEGNYNHVYTYLQNVYLFTKEEECVKFYLHEITKNFNLLRKCWKRKKKQKEKKKKKKKKKNIKNEFLTILEEETLEKLKRKKKIDQVYDKKIKEYVRTNKSIATFKRFIEGEFSIHVDVGKKKKRILVNIETDMYFNDILIHVSKFLNALVGYSLINHGGEKNDIKDISVKYMEEIKQSEWIQLLEESMSSINTQLYNRYTMDDTFLIRKIDANLLYMIDNDITLLKILFYFDLISIFVGYLYVKLGNKEMQMHVSLLLTLLSKLRQKIKFTCNHLLEHKNLSIVFFIWSYLLQDQLDAMDKQKKIEESENTKVDKETADEILRISNADIKKEENKKKEFTSFLNNIKIPYFINRKKISENSLQPKEEPNDHPCETVDGNANINSYNQRNEVWELKKDIKEETKNSKINMISPENILSYPNKFMNNNNNNINHTNVYTYIKNNDENFIDVAHLTINISLTSVSNISFYKNYIIEHVHNLLVNKYKLKIRKKYDIYKDTEKKEENKSYFHEYVKFFDQIFSLKNII